MLEFLYIGVTHNSSASMTNNLLRHRMPRVSFQRGREKQALFPPTREPEPEHRAKLRGLKLSAT